MNANRTMGTRLPALLLSLALGAAPALAQAPPANQAAAPARDAGQQSGGGTQEGIKVHGDWTIVVRNADGSVAARHEFQNALVGRRALQLLLARGGSAGLWSVWLAGPDGPCMDDGLPAMCELRESAGPPTFGTLLVSAPTAGPDADTLVIKGSTKAVHASQVTRVETLIDVCNPAGPVSVSCSAGLLLSGSFTVKDVTALNINVQAGQTMDVTVRISFS